MLPPSKPRFWLLGLIFIFLFLISGLIFIFLLTKFYVRLTLLYLHPKRHTSSVGCELNFCPVMACSLDEWSRQWNQVQNSDNEIRSKFNTSHCREKRVNGLSTSQWGRQIDVTLGSSNWYNHMACYWKKGGEASLVKELEPVRDDCVSCHSIKTGVIRGDDHRNYRI